MFTILLIFYIVYIFVKYLPFRNNYIELPTDRYNYKDLGFFTYDITCLRLYV